MTNQFVANRNIEPSVDRYWSLTNPERFPKSDPLKILPRTIVGACTRGVNNKALRAQSRRNLFAFRGERTKERKEERRIPGVPLKNRLMIGRHFPLVGVPPLLLSLDTDFGVEKKRRRRTAGRFSFSGTALPIFFFFVSPHSAAGSWDPLKILRVRVQRWFTTLLF